MAEERAQRRLAAILAADVVGYSRLMEQDEAGTLAALKERRKEVLEPLVARHQGRIFKITGDGVLVEFGSAVNAVQCAVDLQQGMAAANRDQPEDRRIVLRVGINLGDVMVEGSDLYGDGVNIAARLEAIAEPGGILVSGTVHDHVGNKIKVGFEDLGTQTLKNIAEPVRAYRVDGTPAVVRCGTQAATGQAFDRRAAIRQHERRSGAAIFQRRHHRRHHHRTVRFRNCCSWFPGTHLSSSGTGRWIKDIAKRLRVGYVVRGEHSEEREPHADHGATDRCRLRRPCLGEH